MTLEQLAYRLPAKYRRQLLDDNVIYKAVAKSTDVHMHMLFILYKEYFDPGNSGLSLECGVCIGNMLDKFRMLEPIFVNIEKKEQLLAL